MTILTKDALMLSALLELRRFVITRGTVMPPLSSSQFNTAIFVVEGSISLEVQDREGSTAVKIVEKRGIAYSSRGSWGVVTAGPDGAEILEIGFLAGQVTIDGEERK